MNDVSRITFVVSGENNTAERNWVRASESRTRLVFLQSPAVIQQGLRSEDSQVDIERIVLDRCVDSDEFLDLLASLPPALTADVLFVRPTDGRGFLSALGRGGDRVLYALSPFDVGFYLETHALVAPRFLGSTQSLDTGRDARA